MRRDRGVHWRRRRPGITRAAAALALLTALAGCSAAAKAGTSTRVRATTSTVSATHSASPSASKPSASKPSASKKPARKPAPAKPTALPVAPPDSGTLPQTSAFPRTTDTAFRNAVHDIWLAVTTGNPDYALPAFFPPKAYEQVKAIADPASDWKYRLWYDFTLDLAAVHQLVGTHATLTEVIVPTQYAVWIPAGACYNNIGYWHAPGSRIVYREGGVTRSFGIASFISWRGDWYLIHFGAVVRSGAYGIVDDPEAGPGVPGPPGNC
jgi:hypothetical protein